MAKYKAVFLDRDGTISRTNTAKCKERDAYIGQLLGVENFTLTSELFSQMFNKVGAENADLRDITTVEQEGTYWRKWYQYILEEHGVSGDSKRLAAVLYEKFSFHELKEPYLETLNLLSYLHSKGLKIGVISDTFPSLKKSLEVMGIAHYFQAFVCSSEVGVMKPDPRIFEAALAALGVRAEESIFVDDCAAEAEGARVLGFTSFHLNRSQANRDMETWTIGNLLHVIEFLEEEKPATTTN